MITEYNGKDLDNLINKEIVLLFYTEGCGPCNKIEELLLDKKMNILKINIDMYPELIEQYDIEVVPTILLFKEGFSIKKQVGFQSINNLYDFIN